MSKAYYELGVVENLVVSATEKVGDTIILEYVVDGASYTFPVAERQRVLGIDAVATAVPVVLPTCTHKQVYCTVS